MKPLWEHQSRDIQTMLSTPETFNMSDPGTGKTRVVIEAIRQLGLPTLILAPKSILQCAWGNDIEEFAPELTYTVATATNRSKAFGTDSQIIITNHDAVTWLVQPANERHLARFKGGLLVVDESTCYKNPTAKRSKAAAAIRESFSRATLMSGTPTPQGIIDLWHQMYLVDRGQLLGNSFYRFRSTTHTPVNKGAFTEWVEKEGVADAIADIVSGVTIRNAREDCMDLPENLVVHRRYKLSESHLKVYNELKRHAFIELESGDVNAVNAAVLLSKLLQVASGAVYDEYGEAHLIDTQRYELVMDLVDERDHSVVFFNFKHQKNELIKLAEKAKMKYAVIDGSVSGPKRNDAVTDFQAGKLKGLFCHPQSAGHGITLTKGTATIWVSPTYNVEHFEQANARIFRGGQTKKTETILISAEGTVDARAYRALFDKQLDMNNLLEVLR